MINWFKRSFIAVYNHPVSKIKVESGIIDSHYQLGSVHPDINSTGDWSNITTVNKRQNKNGLETMDCTCFGLSTCLKTIAKFKWNEDWDLSERYMGKMCGTTYQGNNMTTVLDTIRKISGVVNEIDWPWTTESTWDDFYSSIPKSIIAKGQDWTKAFLLSYEVVPMNKNSIFAAFKKAPLYVSGYAWVKGADGMYHSWGRANHCFGGMLVKMNQDGSYVIKDSYPDNNGSYYKTLAPDFLFGGIFAIYLDKIQPMTFLQTLLARGLKWVLLTTQTVINGTTYGAGVYNITANGATPDTVKQDLYDAGVKSLEAQHQLTGINPVDFERLITNKI